MKNFNSEKIRISGLDKLAEPKIKFFNYFNDIKLKYEDSHIIINFYNDFSWCWIGLW